VPLLVLGWVFCVSACANRPRPGAHVKMNFHLHASKTHFQLTIGMNLSEFISCFFASVAVPCPTS